MRRICGYAAFTAAMVYVALKVAWIAGSTFGLRDLSAVTRAEWVADNVVTGGLGVVGAVVALATVRPWGRRLPLWLVAPPMWAGAGLLVPFLVLAPAAAVFRAAGWWSPPPPSTAGPVLEWWSFVLVYGSFVLLGAGLVVALPAYAWTRIRPAVRGAMDRTPPGATRPAQVPLAWTAAALATVPVGIRLHLLLGGGTAPRDALLRLGDLVTVAQIACGVVGVLALAHRWGGDRPFARPLIATWLGGGGMLAAGLLGMATIVTGDQWAPAGQTVAMHGTATFLTFVSGAAISVVALFLLVERSASRVTAE